MVRLLCSLDVDPAAAGSLRLIDQCPDSCSPFIPYFNLRAGHNLRKWGVTMSHLIASFHWLLGRIRLPHMTAAILHGVGAKIGLSLVIPALFILPVYLFALSPTQPPADEHTYRSSSAITTAVVNTTDLESEQPLPHSPSVDLPVSSVGLPQNPETVRQTGSAQTRALDNFAEDVMYVANSRQIGRTRNFSSPSPSWISITGAISGTIYDFVLDPLDPYNHAWVVGTTGVWKTANLNAEAPVWTQILPMQTISETVGPHDQFYGVARILPSPVKWGYFLITIWDDNPLGGPDQGGWIGRTFNSGETWQWSQLPSDDPFFGQPNHSALTPHTPLDMADDGSGRIWLGLANDSGRPRIHYSSDWGKTWQYIKGISRNWTQPRNMYIPDHNPNLIYMNQGYSLTQSTDGGYTWVDITPAGAKASMKPRGMAGIELWPDQFFFVSEATSRGPVYHSSDSGASFPVTFTTPLTLTPNLFAGNNSVVATLSDFDPNRLAALALPACSGNYCRTQQIAIGFSADGGLTWSNRTGNWHTVFGSWAGATGSSAADGNVFIRSLASYDPTCPNYDFTGVNSIHDFRREVGSHNRAGWRTVWDPTRSVPNKGKLVIQRGMTSDTLPLLQDLVEDPAALQSIRQVRIEYSWLSAPGQTTSTLPATSTVTATIELTYTGQYTSVAKLLASKDEPRGEDGRFISRFDFANITPPTGLRVGLQLTDPDQVIFLKKVVLCFEGDVPRRPPVVPLGASGACDDLLLNIQSRSQPFGVSGGTPTPSQDEFNFVDPGVTLELYPYRLNTSGYPASLTYDPGLPDEAALVACTFKRNGQYYPDLAKPIVRFTAINGRPERREQLTLLNYAGYFSVGSPNWCYANDNVFTMTYDRSDGTKYGPGYNVPAPKYRCDTGAFVTNRYGPCATFVGSVYRAMGYFDVSAIANAYNSDAQSTINVVSDLYHAVIPYVERLKTNAYNPVSRLIVRTDPSYTSTYVTRPVSFAAIRAHSLYDCEDEEYDSDDRFCLQGNQIIGDDKNDQRTWGNDTKPLTVTLAPRGPQLPLYDPVGIWESIKAGDIAITVIEQNDHGGEIPTHIQIVVGWGPRYKNGQETRQGAHLYPTYDDIPITDTYKYVPYVMDRYSLPGTGGTTGPRPFNYGLSSTATDFWVVDYSPTHFMQKFTRAVKQFFSASAGPDRALTPSQAQNDPVMPLPLYVPGSVVWSPDGNRIALGNQYGIALYTPNLSHATPLTGATSTVATLAWSPDSTRLASAEAAQQVTIWDVTSGNKLATLKGHSSQLTGVAWSPNGNQIASSSKDGTIRAWNAHTFALSTTLPYTGTGYVNALAWSPGGDRLAASDATAIYIWNMTAGQMVTSFNIEPGPSGSLTWTPDGQFLITPGARRWNAITGEIVSEYAGCSSGTDTFVALSPDGQRLAGIGTAATGSSACIDRLDDQYQQIDQIFLQTYEGIDSLGSIAWSPDSQQVVLATQHGWLSLWNADTGELLAAAPRLTTTPEELETLVQECVADDTVMLQLTYKLLVGDYAGFIAAVQSQPAGMMEPACQQQLIKTAEFLTNNPLLPLPDPVAPQPLSLEYVCSQNPGEWVWRVRNPNSFEVPVVWGWEDQWPTPGGFPFVVPAASNGVAGEWLITTPAQTGSRTLKILSGGFVATAQSKVFCSDIWLPVVLRGSH